MKCTIIFKGTEEELDKVKDKITYATIYEQFALEQHYSCSTIYEEVEPTYRCRTLKELVDMYGDAVDISKELGYVHVNEYSMSIRNLGKRSPLTPLKCEWDSIFLMREGDK